MARTLNRTPSETSLGKEDAETGNRNVQWVHYPLTAVTYVAAIIIIWFVAHASKALKPGECWTVTNLVHGVVSFHPPFSLFFTF